MRRHSEEIDSAGHEHGDRWLSIFRECLRREVATLQDLRIRSPEDQLVHQRRSPEIGVRYLPVTDVQEEDVLLYQKLTKRTLRSTDSSGVILSYALDKEIGEIPTLNIDMELLRDMAVEAVLQVTDEQVSTSRLPSEIVKKSSSR